MFGIIINEEGYKVEFVVLNEKKEVQYYELKENETVIEQGWEIANGMGKPKWTGIEWFDEEPKQIDICPIKTVEERLEEAEQENKLLKAQVEVNASNNEFLENCIIEMAQMVYA